MKTTRINGEDVPVIDAVKSVTTISNKITGIKYATEEEWKKMIKLMGPPFDLSRLAPPKY